MMESAITAPPAVVLRLLSRSRSLNFYRLCAAVTVQGVLAGYSLKNIRALMAQAALESNWGISSLAEDHSNFFGMWKPSKRVYYAIGSVVSHDGAQPVEYLKYRSPWQCVKDRIAWDKEFNESVWPYRNANNYLEAVAGRYHGSPTYAGSWANVTQIHQSEFKRATAVTLAVIPVEFWLLAKLF